MITVVPASGDLRQTALTLLHSRFPPGEREEQLALMLGSSQRGELPLDDLLLAQSGGNPVGALLAVRQPGRMAFVWPPVVEPTIATSSPARDAVVDALLQAAGRQMDAQSILFSQCVLELDDDAERSRMTRNGFVRAADLMFLGRSLRIPLPPQEAMLESVAFDERERERFTRVIDRTFTRTMDCPVLNGVRSASEALAAHQATGTFDPGRCRIYTSGGDDIGVLLVGDDPERDAWEVAYLGVVPEARGHGYGRAILLDGLEQARRAGIRAMYITVDSQNTCAVAIYEQLGFTIRDLRAVHLRIGQLTDSSESG